STMVTYLIERIERQPQISILTDAEVVAVIGDKQLSAITIEHRASGEREDIPAGAMFVLIGAAPYTRWLTGVIHLDDVGFIRTGTRLGKSQRDEPWRSLGRDPMLLETSLPGVFAVGDVRAGAINRVGSAVGDGSVAARLVHEFLTAKGASAL